MNELRDLYQEVILDHARQPRNHRVPEDAESFRCQEGFNPLCGDRLVVYLKVEDDTVTDCAFKGTGCAISQASASVMTEAVKGQSPEQIADLFTRFHDLVTGVGGDASDLGKLAVFEGVSEFPARVKCASLAWHALNGALCGEADGAVTTESASGTAAGEAPDAAARGRE